jgi:hypothetical protein
MMTAAQNLQTGDTIMPPPREVKLWMRRTLEERKLPEAALYLTVAKVEESAPDKGGRWLRVTADHTPEWANGCNLSPFVFRVRPETPWQKIA